MRECSICGGAYYAKGVCRKHYDEERYWHDPEATRARRRGYYAANPRAFIAATMRYRATPAGAMNHRAGSRKWAEANKERVLQRAREWQKKNYARAVARIRDWQKANREKFRAYQATSKARRRGAAGKHTGAEVLLLFERQHGKCAICACALAKYHKDHIVALSRGGTNFIANIQLLCPPCNMAKHAKDLDAFLKERGYK